MLRKVLLFGLSACACSALARPTRNRPKLHRVPEQDQTPQRYFGIGSSHPWSFHRQSPTYSPGHLEAAPNSIGLLFTTPDAEEVTHVWLPLGRKMFTRDNPNLPLHPLTARITTLIRSSPELATPERLSKVRCKIYAHVNETSEPVARPEPILGRASLVFDRRREKANSESVSFARTDGLVRLAEAGSAFWLGGREVEGYECN